MKFVHIFCKQNLQLHFIIWRFHFSGLKIISIDKDDGFVLLIFVLDFGEVQWITGAQFVSIQYK